MPKPHKLKRPQIIKLIKAWQGIDNYEAETLLKEIMKKIKKENKELYEELKRRGC